MGSPEVGVLDEGNGRGGRLGDPVCANTRPARGEVVLVDQTADLVVPPDMAWQRPAGRERGWA
jgi:hypothetical protein